MYVVLLISFILHIFNNSIIFSAFMLLVWRQERHYIGPNVRN